MNAKKTGIKMLYNEKNSTKKYLDPKRHMKRLVGIVSFYALTQASVLCVFVLFLSALMALLVQ